VTVFSAKLSDRRQIIRNKFSNESIFALSPVFVFDFLVSGLPALPWSTVARPSDSRSEAAAQSIDDVDVGFLAVDHRQIEQSSAVAAVGRQAGSRIKTHETRSILTI
jgi:hypothetical protein